MKYNFTDLVQQYKNGKKICFIANDEQSKKILEKKLNYLNINYRTYDKSLFVYIGSLEHPVDIDLDINDIIFDDDIKLKKTMANFTNFLKELNNDMERTFNLPKDKSENAFKNALADTPNRISLTKRIFINKSKKIVVVKFYDRTIIEKCDIDDKFDWKIGFGLCLSKLYNNNYRFKQHREFFRNKQTRKLDYKKYAKWCIIQALNNDMIELDRIEREISNNNCATL